jgi:hypothetical protein
MQRVSGKKRMKRYAAAQITTALQQLEDEEDQTEATGAAEKAG